MSNWMDSLVDVEVAESVMFQIWRRAQSLKQLKRGDLQKGV